MAERQHQPRDDQPGDSHDRHAWEHVGTFEVAPGIHRIPLPLPGDHLHAVNVYAIPDGDRVVLIDGGMAIGQTGGLLESGLNRIGYRLEDVRDFFITHVHRDHFTQAIAVRREFGTKVHLGEGERLTIDVCRKEDWSSGADALKAAGAAHLAPLGSIGPADPSIFEEPDHWLTTGVDLPLTTRHLRVIATPGHTRGHVVFHDPDANILFSGDHVLPHITPSIGFQLPRPSFPELPLRDFMDSLQLVLGLPDAILLPAHGPSGGSTHVRAHELIRHHTQRLATTADVLLTGASTAYDVAAELRWTRHNRRLTDLDPENQMLAILETAAHLDVLVLNADALRSVNDVGVAHYRSM